MEQRNSSVHRKVNFLQYVKTDSGWTWKPIPKKGKNNTYLWAALESPHLYITWRDHKGRHYEKAGSTPSEALEAKRRKEFELAGRAVLERGWKGSPLKTGLTIKEAVASFLDSIKARRRPNTFKRYRAIMGHFRKFFRAHTDVAEITPADIDAFRDWRLGEKSPFDKVITPRNVNHEVATIRAFYYWLQRFMNPELSNPAARLKPLAVARKLVDVYEEEELEQFFKACEPEELAIFKMFYYTGLRDQELAHMHWNDVNFKKGVLAVRSKPQEGFIPKDWEERQIPMHPELIRLLKNLPRRHPCLVFPSFEGKPNGHLLRMLKVVQDRACLPGRWYLHKFRKTFATRALERGADIRTVQQLLGHRNITTTAHYLGSSTERMREAVGRL